jgi:hypothetical protein
MLVGGTGKGTGVEGRLLPPPPVFPLPKFVKRAGELDAAAAAPLLAIADAQPTGSFVGTETFVFVPVPWQTRGKNCTYNHDIFCDSTAYR